MTIQTETDAPSLPDIDPLARLLVGCVAILMAAYLFFSLWIGQVGSISHGPVYSTVTLPKYYAAAGVNLVPERVVIGKPLPGGSLVYPVRITLHGTNHTLEFRSEELIPTPGIKRITFGFDGNYDIGRVSGNWECGRFASWNLMQANCVLKPVHYPTLLDPAVLAEIKQNPDQYVIDHMQTLLLPPNSQLPLS